MSTKKSIQSVINFNNNEEFESWQENHNGCPEIILSVHPTPVGGVRVVYWKARELPVMRP